MELAGQLLRDAASVVERRSTNRLVKVKGPKEVSRLSPPDPGVKKKHASVVRFASELRRLALHLRRRTAGISESTRVDPRLSISLDPPTTAV